MDEAVGNGSNRELHRGKDIERERERKALSVQKAEETCLFASDVVNADSL